MILISVFHCTYCALIELCVSFSLIQEVIMRALMRVKKGNFIVRMGDDNSLFKGSKLLLLILSALKQDFNELETRKGNK